MIKFLKYAEIDFGKYEKCLNSSVQQKYSAKKKFLDTVTSKRWCLLVLNDYEAVMPIFCVKKFGIKIVLMPKLCQQLGVFSKEDKSEINERFLAFLQENFLVSYYAFNDKNKFETQLLKRKNYIIQRNSYDDIFKNYSENRRREIKKYSKNSFEISKISFNDAEHFIEKNFAGNFSKKEKTHFLKIYNDFRTSGTLELSCFISESGTKNLIGIYHAKKSVVLLLLVNDKKFAQNSGATMLIDNALKTYSAQRDFDFEGSNIPAVEEFYRRFGAKLCAYPVIQNTEKNLFFKLLKQFPRRTFFNHFQK